MSSYYLIKIKKIMDLNFITISYIVAGFIALIVVFFTIKWFFSLRRVVPTTEVHIIRQSKKTIVYGAPKQVLSDSSSVISPELAGNTYYQFPASFPVIGVSVSKLMLDIFSIKLPNYEAYDKDRVPFVVEIMAFFRISNYIIAAERVRSTEELRSQLQSIVQGAVRAILAKDSLNNIMENRATYGQQFTEEVSEALKEWGVETTKPIELMDVQDRSGEHVIDNIMAKKKSYIEMESRKEVAQNNKTAQESEILAAQEVALIEQKKREIVGQREAEVEQKVGIAKEQAQQKIQEEAKTTQEKEMAVLEVKTVRQAEINKKEILVIAGAEKERADVDKETLIVKAEADKKQIEINAEAAKKKVILEAEAEKNKMELAAEADKKKVELTAQADKTKVELTAEAEKKRVELAAEAHLAQETNRAKGIAAVGESNAVAIAAEGKATAEAKFAFEEAVVQGQITLAKEIGENQGYQTYLIAIRNVEATEAVGMKQAENLGHANIKILAQPGAGGIQNGVNSVFDLFTSKGATAISSLMEGLSASDGGSALLEKLGLKVDDEKTGRNNGEDFEPVK